MRIRLNQPSLSHYLFAASAFTLAMWATPSVARADDGDTAGVIALDMDFAAPLTDSESNPGGGGALRFGRKYSLILLSLTPEVGFGYHQFGGSSDATLYRGFVGGRVGIGAIVEPSAFVHVGVGKLDRTTNDRWAPVADVGLALDLTLLPLINLGVHGAYNTVLPRSEYRAFGWLSVGIHAALVW
jgi:hypothetical protein